VSINLSGHKYRLPKERPSSGLYGTVLHYTIPYCTVAHCYTVTFAGEHQRERAQVRSGVPGVGWVVWRHHECLPTDLIFHVNYLGQDQPTFTLNFSKGQQSTEHTPVP